MRRLLLAVCLVALGCDEHADGGPVDEPLPRLPVVDAATDDNGHYPIDILDGEIPDWPQRITRLPAGPIEILVRNQSQHPDDPNEDLAIALWLRGRGSRRHFLPQYASPPLFPETMEDWSVDLARGTYDLSVSLGGSATVSVVVVE